MNEIVGILLFFKLAKLRYPPDCYSESSLLELVLSQHDITDTVTLSQDCIIRSWLLSMRSNVGKMSSPKN